MKRFYRPVYRVLCLAILLFLVPLKADFSGTTGFLSWSFAEAEIYNYYLPYALSNKDYWTGVALKNGSTTNSASVTVTGIKQNGSAFYSQVKSIPPLGQSAFMMNTGEGWVKVASDQPLTGLAFIAESIGDALMFDMTLIPDLAETLYIPHVAQDATWDTVVYVCNPHSSATTIYLTFVKSDGMLVTSKGYTLGVNTSGTYPLSDVVGGGKYSSGSIQITASQGVAAFALYQNLKSGAKSYAGISALAPEEPPSSLPPLPEEGILGNFTFTYTTRDGTTSERITINKKSTNKTSDGTYFYEGYDADDPSDTAVGAWYPSKSKYVIETYIEGFGWFPPLIIQYNFSINSDNTLTGFCRVGDRNDGTWGSSDVLIKSQSYKEPLGSW